MFTTLGHTPRMPQKSTGTLWCMCIRCVSHLLMTTQNLGQMHAMVDPALVTSQRCIIYGLLSLETRTQCILCAKIYRTSYMACNRLL